MKITDEIVLLIVAPFARLERVSRSSFQICKVHRNFYGLGFCPATYPGWPGTQQVLPQPPSAGFTDPGHNSWLNFVK
jgi:hypothetical protein